LYIHQLYFTADQALNQKFTKSSNNSDFKLILLRETLVLPKKLLMIPARLLTYKDAPEEMSQQGIQKLQNHFGDFEFDFASDQPLLLLFLSGGSESFAIKTAQPHTFYILIGFEDNNSWAAATEVKAWMDQHEIDALMLDLTNAADRNIIRTYCQNYDCLSRLKGKKLGLIGEISDWLVASDIDEKVLFDKLGITLKKISWSSLPNWKSMNEDGDFVSNFRSPSNESIESASKVNRVLEVAISQNQLDAITVECFSLVQNEGVTACLSLSHLNDRGIPAGCEGDLTSIVGLMLAQAVTGQIPWMANLVRVMDEQSQICPLHSAHQPP
jgi:L-fucose isomerase-like protein